VLFPKPVQGLVIRYSYLWRMEHMRGQEEGAKDRPCAVILVTMAKDGREIVTVLPVTHSRNQTTFPRSKSPTKPSSALGLIVNAPGSS
jgi:mRNA-degrading endonuclease toxin of MazEF toxin-antitoxin module